MVIENDTSSEALGTPYLIVNDKILTPPILLEIRLLSSEKS